MKKIISILLLLSLSLSLWGCGKSKKYIVGVCQLAPHEALDSATKGFVDTLRAEFGDEIDIIVNNASGDESRCATIVDGFVADNVDLIMANATSALQAAATATNSIPILGTSITEYGVALGLDNFDGLVGTNVSGTSDLAPLDKQAQMIIDLVPTVKKVGLLFCSSEANSIYQVKEVRKYLESKGISCIEFSFVDDKDVFSTTQQACEECDCLFIPTDNVAANCAETINNAASSYKTPIFAGEQAICKVCGVVSLSIDYYQLGVITAKMAITILKGEKEVSKMPIQYYENPQKVYNPDLCEKLGIIVDDSYKSCK